jgi:hypothetical protein
MIIMTGAFVGFIVGVLVPVLIGFFLDDPFGVTLPGDWTDYPSLILGSLGAIGGAVLGRIAYDRPVKPRSYVSVPRRPAKLGDPPYRGPFG